MTGTLLEHPRLRTLLSRAAREVADVAKAKGIHLRGDPAERAEAVAKATGANRASMLQDLERGVPRCSSSAKRNHRPFDVRGGAPGRYTAQGSCSLPERTLRP